MAVVLEEIRRMSVAERLKLLDEIWEPSWRSRRRCLSPRRRRGRSTSDGKATASMGIGHLLGRTGPPAGSGVTPGFPGGKRKYRKSGIFCDI